MSPRDEQGQDARERGGTNGRPASDDHGSSGDRPVIGDRPTVTRDRRERADPHDPPVPENVRRLRPAEVHNSPPGRRGPARDAAARHATGAPPPTYDFATGKERRPQDAGGAEGPTGRVLPPPRSSPPPSAPPEDPLPPARTVALKGRPKPGGPGPGGPGDRAAGAEVAPRRAPGAPRRLGVPLAVRVQSGASGRPVRIEGDAVDAVRESWLVEDRWWTDRPLRRRYWEVVTTSGRDSIVFRDLVDGRWYRQR